MIAKKKDQNEQQAMSKILFEFRLQWPWYPFLFVCYPVLNLYAANIGWVKIQWILPALIASLLGVGLIYVVVSLSLRSVSRGALFTLLAILLFFSFGHGFAMFETMVTISGLSHMIVGRNRFMVPLWGVLLVMGTAGAIWMPNRYVKPLTRFLNVSALVLIALSLVSIGWTWWGHLRSGDHQRYFQTEPDLLALSTSQKPNIYLIILDGYARNDVLQRCYGYDNSDFTDWLVERGFIVPANSRSNYSQTILSLGSMLNMEYYGVDGDPYGGMPLGRMHSRLSSLIENNRVEQSLKAANYRVVRIASHWAPTNGSRYADINHNLGLVSESLAFTDKLLSTTILRLFNLRGGEQVGPPSWLETTTNILRFYRMRGPQHDLLEYTFQELTNLSSKINSAFVLAHIVSPHPPYLFDRNGNLYLPDDTRSYSGEWQDKYGYIEQIQFLNRNLKMMVESIIENSRIRPIILLQADHGANGGVCSNDGEFSSDFMETATSNFSAYYFPGTLPGEVNAPMTPVNLFRLIFRRYFGASIEVYEDKTYYSSQETPFHLIQLP